MRRTRLVTITVGGVGKQAGVVQRGLGDFGGGAVMAMPQSARWPWRRSKGGRSQGRGLRVERLRCWRGWPLDVKG